MLRGIWMFMTLVAAAAFVLAAGGASIGIVKARGEFRLDSTEVWGNGTLYDGNSIETSKVSSDLELASGSRFSLGSESRSRVWRDRVVLERGNLLVRDARGSAIEARSLRILPGPGARMEIALNGPRKVQVAALDGPAEVRNGQGVLVASLGAGHALEFDPQAYAATMVKLTGVVSSKGGHYFLEDKTTGVVVELRGDNLAKIVGKLVQVSGSVIPEEVAAPGAAQVVHVTDLKPVGAGAGKTSGPNAHAGAASGGLSHGATAAIIGGVAVGGTVAGLYAAGTIGGGAPVSR